jgi:hypothetical protein
MRQLLGPRSGRRAVLRRIHLSLYRGDRPVLNRIMNLRLLWRQWIFLSIWATVRLYGVSIMRSEVGCTLAWLVQLKNSISILLLLLSMGWDCVSELPPPIGVLFALQMVYEHWWNDIDRRKLKKSEKNLSQCHFVRHKSHMEWPGREPLLRARRLTAWAMARPSCTRISVTYLALWCRTFLQKTDSCLPS